MSKSSALFTRFVPNTRVLNRFYPCFTPTTRNKHSDPPPHKQKIGVGKELGMGMDKRVVKG